MFLIGFTDDLKISIKPSKRLLMMIISLFVVIYFLPVKIFYIDIPFLIPLYNQIFFAVFILICFYLLSMEQILSMDLMDYSH